MTEFFPQRSGHQPMIYAYEENNPLYQGLLKVGYTAVDVKTRVEQQYPVKRPDGLPPYSLRFQESAMREDGSSFTDKDVHAWLRRHGYLNKGGEWFLCTPQDVQAAVTALRLGIENAEERTRTFSMRPEQARAVERAAAYFRKEAESGHTPKFLWNAKMRFGKTFAAYQLAKRMKMRRVLILTFKPAVQSAWEEDLKSHVDFEGWQFISRPKTPGEPAIDGQYRRADKTRPIVCFGSFQDFLGEDPMTGGIKAQHEWVHETHWDMVIFDEYHFGAWKDNAKNLFSLDDEAVDEDLSGYERGNAYDETWLPITANDYLYLSGTPFRALNSGEFIEDQIYNWTYSDEQRAKAEWNDAEGLNPYAALPRMVMLTYQIPESIRNIALKGEFNEFDLNLFFSASKKDGVPVFAFEEYVQKWLDLIRGAYQENAETDLKAGSAKPPMPYSDTRLLSVLNHTLWFLPNVDSCEAMARLLKQPQNVFFHDYTVNVCAGAKAGVGLAALGPVRSSMEDPLHSKTITLSCGKLTTGVTIRPWTGILMLRNMSSPETYFQAAFRVQSPWTMPADDPSAPAEIIKRECYVFDFALDRALKQIADYGSRLNVGEGNPEQKVGEFIHFLPVLAYDGSSMKEVNAADILDYTLSGTSATLLARRWDSPLLVNVDDLTLRRVLECPEALRALEQIEDFRSLSDDISTIINKTEGIKKAKKEPAPDSAKKKKEISQEEKELKSKRKKIQEKLRKLASRIPIFMYLTDYREYSLKDVILDLEPELFKKVTGLSVKDFDLLVHLNVFNESLMNDAVYKFKRYEDASLEYAGVNRHAADEAVGLFNTTLRKEDYEALNRLEEKSAEPFTENPPDFSKAMEIPRSKKAAPETPSVPATRSAEPEKTKEPPQRPAFKRESVKVGMTVRHKSFGFGSVTELDKNTIWVMFPSINTVKKFSFPDAFYMGFLLNE